MTRNGQMIDKDQIARLRNQFQLAAGLLYRLKSVVREQRAKDDADQALLLLDDIKESLIALGVFRSQAELKADVDGHLGGTRP